MSRYRWLQKKLVDSVWQVVPCPRVIWVLSSFRVKTDSWYRGGKDQKGRVFVGFLHPERSIKSHTESSILRRIGQVP